VITNVDTAIHEGKRIKIAKTVRSCGELSQLITSFLTKLELK